MGDRSELKIFINFSKDGTTLARMVKLLPNCGTKELKRGTAKCHPDDKFDPQIGAMIALARMFGDEVEFKSEKEAETKREAPHRMSPVEKRAKDNGYTLVRDRLPSCTAYDGTYYVMTGKGCEGGGLYWSHKFQSFSSLDHDNDDRSNSKDGEIARKIWMDGTDGVPIIAWKPQPDAVEQKALDDGYTLCRDRYPDKSGKYDFITEYGGHLKTIPWSSRWKTFGACDGSEKPTANMGIRAWMTKGHDPAIAWKEHK